MIGLSRYARYVSTSAFCYHGNYGNFAGTRYVSNVTVRRSSASNNLADVTSEFDMSNTRLAYASKNSLELLRAYSVFRLCSYEVLVNHQKKLLDLSRRLLGRRLFRRAMRMSVYGQFMAGETQQEILKVAQHHHNHNVRPMFAYTARENHGFIPGISGLITEADLFNTNHAAIRGCIEMATLSPKFPGEYVKVTCKLTAIGTAEIFRTMTTVIETNTEIVKVARQKALTSSYWKTVLEALEELVTSHEQGSMEQVANETGLPLPTNFRELDWRSLTTCQAFHVAVSRSTKIAGLLKEPEEDGLQYCPITVEQETELITIWRRMDDLAERALAANVCLVVDAEQTYLQASMDLLTLDLMRRYNATRPVLHNTYQCYLKRTYDVITRDLATADAEGFSLGGKIVRGGYLDEERALAAKNDTTDPVNPTFEATTAVYYSVAEELLSTHARGATVQATFATHNEATVKHIIGLMKAHGITSNPNVFAFAQLLGMRDHIAFILGQANFPAKKLIHYGDIEDGTAYLSRRLVENRSGVPTANVERTMLGREISRRVFSGEFFKLKSV